MKIGIDIRCLSDGKTSGVEEYTLNLLNNLFAMDQENQYVLFLNSYGETKFDSQTFQQFSNVKVKKFNIPNKLLNFCFWYLRWPHVDKMLGGVDVFFMPNLNFVALSKDTKLVLTVHDLSFEIFPETFSIVRRLWHQFVNPRRLCKLASKLIAISDSTKHDLIEMYKVPENKIVKIYNGASDDFKEIGRNDVRLLDVKEKYHLPFNFIFFLGTIEPRKNIKAIVDAYDQLRSLKNPELDKYKLVIAGGKGWGVEKILNHMRNAKFNQDIIFTNRITNEDKSAVYNLASLFVYPSFFEGFGLPVLEAMKCRVPVITSNCSSLPEVVGDAGVMIDPDRPDEIFLAMKEILLKKDFQIHLKEKQRWQAFKFNWRTTAREFLETLRSLK
jgi:glycosyltransferase involved in cell wall biosynthesis